MINSDKLLLFVNKAEIALDVVISQFLALESPMDARIASQSAPYYSLFYSDTTLPLETLEELIFSYLLENMDDLARLAELCHVTKQEPNGFFSLNYIDIFLALDQTREIEFICETCDHSKSIKRFKILAALDALISIGNIIVLRNKKNIFFGKRAINAKLFTEALLLIRDLQNIYAIDKYKTKPLLVRNDGEKDPRLDKINKVESDVDCAACKSRMHETMGEKLVTALKERENDLQ